MKLKAGMRIKYQTRGMTRTGEILWRLVDCDGTVTYSVRESNGSVYGVSPADVMEVESWWDAQARSTFAELAVELGLREVES